MTAGEAGPLEGRRILLTRRPEQSSSLARRLEESGARVVTAPAIEVLPPEDSRPLDDALGALERYDWLVFTSANAVRAVRERLGQLGLPLVVGGRGPRVATVGPSTSEAVRASFPGAVVAVEPTTDYRAEGLAGALLPRLSRGDRCLLPISNRARDVLSEALTHAGARPDVVVAYRTTAPPGLAERLAEILGGGLDIAVFASPSAVENLAGAAGGTVRGLPAAVIGPVTEAAARSAGLDVRVVAEPSTVEGLVAGLCRYFEARGKVGGES